MGHKGVLSMVHVVGCGVVWCGVVYVCVRVCVCACVTGVRERCVGGGGGI